MDRCKQTNHTTIYVHAAPVNLLEDVQARLEILESHHHLVPPRHHKGEVKDDPVHGDAFVDEDGLDLRLVQELDSWVLVWEFTERRDGTEIRKKRLL